MSRARTAALALALALSASCEPRTIAPRGPTWERDVAPIVAAACVECHGEARAEGGYRLDGYLGAIACPASAEGVPAVEPPGPGAPLLAVLEREDHALRLDARELALLRAWVESGAPARVGAAHPAGWVDPRSPDFHGVALRDEAWARVLDPTSPGACTQCHAGAVSLENDARGVAPGATACTDCHRDADGPLACSTCHGTLGRAHPPRDPCFHPDEATRAGAHEAHAAAGVGCEVCHGERTIEGLGVGLHGTGVVEVALDPARAGEGARFDASARTCASGCHDRGGERPGPAWEAGAELDCASCHASPPEGHYPGACSSCHAEADATGTALSARALHANGVVDLGDGSGGCGACHGSVDDPMPATGAHAAHAMPSSAAPIGCDACHEVPERVEDAGHLDAIPGAEVRFGERARARSSEPTYESGTCRDVACHGAGLGGGLGGGGSVVAPRWAEGEGLAGRCGACHGLPPPAPHPEREGCSTLGCHGALSTPGPGVSELGRAVHTDGRVDLWP